MPSSDVVNLANAFGDDKSTRAFAERYFRVQHTDLLFADAAVFVEGMAERMLVPLFIERDYPALVSRFISFLDIGGRHAHRLRPLVEKLGIPTVVITDIDPILPKTGEASYIDDASALLCGNDTLNAWHPKLTKLPLMSSLTEEQHTWTNTQGGRVRFAWQLPVPSTDGPWPSSFEDSLVLTNMQWFKLVATRPGMVRGAPEKVIGAFGSMVRTVDQSKDPKELCRDLHKLLRNFKKGDFAATLFECICQGAAISCPAYISDALSWLDKELTPRKSGATS